MRKFALLLFILAFSKATSQRIVTGYDYIGRNTFHLGIAEDFRIGERKKSLGLLFTTGVHFTGYEGETRGIFEVTGAITRRTTFVGATYTPYALIPKIGVGKKDAYAYIGYVIPTRADNPLSSGIAVGINMDPLYLVWVPLLLLSELY